ncbi:MAG: glycosyltransferase involved in cell wall biosynthesis [Candidatus Azotimanducaceae bacterium]|jgi:glycosyltransferase involved in cell wall biosynthesis
MILHLGNKLANKGFTPTCVDTLSDLFDSDYNWKAGSDKGNKVFRLLDTLFLILKYKKQASLILIDTYSTQNFWMAYLASRLAKRLNIPYAAILHGGNLPKRFEKSSEKRRKFWYDAYRVISPSKYLQDYFQKQNIPTELIPNGIALKDYTFKERNVFVPNLLYVRALHGIYNPEMAIKVLHQIAIKYPRAKLCMVGPAKDDSLQKCKALALELGIENRVEFTGRLSKPDWLALSTKFDVFINPTHFDNLPVSVIEAMALGIPVVSTNVGGLPYLIDDNRTGLLVEDNDTAAMAAGICSIIENPLDTMQMAINARAEAGHYDWKGIKQLWKQIFDSCEPI